MNLTDFYHGAAVVFFILAIWTMADELWERYKK